MISIKDAKTGLTTGTIELLPSGQVVCDGVARSFRDTPYGSSMSGDDFYSHYRLWSSGYMFSEET